MEDDTKLEWHNVPMELSEFDVGDCITVTYTGGVMESYPAKIEQVIKLRTLDDEKIKKRVREMGKIKKEEIWSIPNCMGYFRILLIPVFV